MKLKKTKSLSFSDVNLLSEKLSTVNSRNEVAFDTNRLIVAPMSAIQNSDFNMSVITAGVSLPIHRFCSIEEQHKLLFEAVSARKLLNSNSFIWLSVSLTDFKQRIGPIYQFMQENQIGVLFDVANGYASNLRTVLKEYNRAYNLPNLMTGNVHTWAGFEFLEDLESKFIRVGIAGGSGCATKDKTGIARGQISCIDDVASELTSAYLISDGAIRSPADVCKAFGAGADFVMMGGYFSKAKESEAQKTGYFYGGASSMQKELIGADKTRYVEGKAIAVDLSEVGLSDIVLDIVDGVKSCVAYSGYSNIEDFIGNGIFE